MNARWHAHYKLKIAFADVEIERLRAVVDRKFEDIDELEDDLADARAKVDQLLQDAVAYREEIQRLTPTQNETVTQEQYNVLAASKCANCGGVHTAACPRVKRIRFQTGGQTPIEVEFWRDDEWPKENVKWIENLVVETPS